MEHLDRLVAEKVRHAMLEAGLSPDELVRRSGLPASALHRRLAAQDSFDLFELVHLAAVLDCRVADLVPAEEEL
ncbi:helix-turn-helix domain-containing protein [Nocardia sp. NPDC052566]|uniref:helix-turn-helix domain-containing protein n=1 Tax=Nocardia sp. NPDC052566 TaxID=3364330 RepID=UPI0037C9BBC9